MLQGCGTNPLTTNRAIFRKGGVGIISSPHLHLFVVLRSERNELIMEGGQRWVGKDAGTTEVVLCFDNKAWTSSDLPPGFELSKSIAISFEGEFVRCFAFEGMDGGYYRRNTK